MNNTYYYSNSGCFKIGNDHVKFKILNAKGEGSFWIKTCKKSEKVKKEGFDFVASVSGDDIFLYECDENDKKIKKLEANVYYVYVKKGNIIIESQI